jgi:hypothetical protein
MAEKGRAGAMRWEMRNVAFLGGGDSLLDVVPRNEAEVSLLLGEMNLKSTSKYAYSAWGYYFKEKNQDPLL